MHTDFSLFDESRHMLEWLDDDPEGMILETLGSMLAKQNPGAALLQFVVTEKPHWLSRGRKDDDDPENVTIIGVGTAFAVTFSVQETTGEQTEVKGIFTVVGYPPDQPGHSNSIRIWFDLDGTLEEFGDQGTLVTRMYNIEE